MATKKTKKIIKKKIAVKKQTKAVLLLKSKPSIQESISKKKVNSSLNGKTFLFTGTLADLTRSEAEALVKLNGGAILSGVTDKLDYLVVGDDAGSKLEKAKKIKSIKVLKEKEFLKLVPSSKSLFAKKEQPAKKIAPSKKANEKKSSSKKVATNNPAAKNSIKSVSSKKESKESTIIFSINAVAQNYTDYSGATITEWFDSGREEDQIACPDNYKKVRNGYLVYWDRSIDMVSFDLLESVLDQIRYWANEYGANFNSGSNVTIEDNDGNVLKKFSFDTKSWS